MKNLFILVLMSIITMEVSAESLFNINDHTLLLGGSFGLLNGQSEEIVYRDEKTDDKLSQLLWDIKPLVYSGIDIRYSWRKPENRWGLFADALLKFGFSGETGAMEDRDWLVLDYPKFLTHYSVHNNKTENALLVDASMGVLIPMFEVFLLKPYISYSFMHFSWTANSGSFLYPPSDKENVIEHAYLIQPIDVGTYEQTWHILAPAVAFYGEFNRYFNIELSLKLSPFVWCSDEDNHIGRNLIITKDTNNGFFFEPGFVFSFVPGDGFFTVSLDFAYRSIRGARGDGKYDYQDESSLITKNMNGTGYSAFNIGIVARIGIL